MEASFRTIPPVNLRHMIDSWPLLDSAVAGLEAGDPASVQPPAFSSPDGSAKVGVHTLSQRFEIAQPDLYNLARESAELS